MADPSTALMQLLQQLTDSQLQTQQMIQQLAQHAPAPVPAPAPAPASQPHGALAHVLKHVRIPSFSGSKEDKSSLDTWFFQMEQVFAALSVTTDKDKLCMAGLAFAGNAAVYWRDVSQQPAQYQPQTWQELKDSLTRMYMPVNKVRLARDRLAAATQRGSLEQYTSYMRSLFLSIPGISDSEKMDRFERGLKPALQEKVRVHLPAPTTLDELIAVAAMYDSTYLAFAASHRHQRGQAQSGTQQGPTPMELGVMKQETGERPRQSVGKRTTGDPDPSTVRCYNCNKIGHFAKDCPLPDRRKKKQGASQQQGKGQERQHQ